MATLPDAMGTTEIMASEGHMQDMHLPATYNERPGSRGRSESCRSFATWAVHSPMLYASLTSCSFRAGGNLAVSLPAMTTPKGVAIVASSMTGVGGLPTTTCQQHQCFHALPSRRVSPSIAGNGVTARLLRYSALAPAVRLNKPSPGGLTDCA